MKIIKIDKIKIVLSIRLLTNRYKFYLFVFFSTMLYKFMECLVYFYTRHNDVMQISLDSCTHKGESTLGGLFLLF